MTLIVCLIGGITFVIVAALGIAEYRRPKGRNDRAGPKPLPTRKKVVLTRSTSREELLAVLADKNCDYRTAVVALKLLGLVNKDSQMVFHRGVCEEFGADRLIEIAGKFWGLRWPEISAAKCDEEITLAAKGLIGDLGLDTARIEELIAIITQKCQPDIAEAMEAEILAQAEQQRQKLTE